MSMLISPEYVALNRELHERIPTYGVGGHKWADWVQLFCMSHRIESVLDYGAGKGALAGALEGSPFVVHEYDPAIPGKDARPALADLVVCTDVLEHVEPECIWSVLTDITSLSRKAVLLGISCKSSGKLLADGRGAHLLVKPAAWWREVLKGYGNFREIPGADHEFNVVMTHGL